ncbi:hypothetical protein SK128_014573, partial [Halocaridina rubra]
MLPSMRISKKVKIPIPNIPDFQFLKKIKKFPTLPILRFRKIKILTAPMNLPLFPMSMILGSHETELAITDIILPFLLQFHKCCNFPRLQFPSTPILPMFLMLRSPKAEIPITRHILPYLLIPTVPTRHTTSSSPREFIGARRDLLHAVCNYISIQRLHELMIVNCFTLTNYKMIWDFPRGRGRLSALLHPKKWHWRRGGTSHPGEMNGGSPG